MSYILDALRRAQAERERGQVPGLEARAMVQTPPPPSRSRATLWWLGGAAVVAALGLATVLLLRGAAAPSVAPAVTLASAPMPPPAKPDLLPAMPAAAQAPIVVVSAPPVPPPVSGPSTVLPSPPVTAPPTSMPVSSAPAPSTSPAQAPSTPPATTPAPAPSAVRAVQLAQLSPELRRELPTLVLGGAIWSDNAASRFVIINGQVLREGEAAAPGVVLERIGPKAVFLRWRDWRIEVPI